MVRSGGSLTRVPRGRPKASAHTEPLPNHKNADVRRVITNTSRNGAVRISAPEALVGNVVFAIEHAQKPCGEFMFHESMVSVHEWL